MEEEKKRLPAVKTYQYEEWTVRTVKGLIMTKEDQERYDKELDLPHIPDMVFVHNQLQIKHKNGALLEFNPLDALKTVNSKEDLIHVSIAEEWLASRKDNPDINKIVHPFDWTFTPSKYYGSYIGFDVSETDLKINYAKLKEREPILFFDEVILYEDELDDNGASSLTLKIRVMASGLFCLLRFYLRVDNTLIRIIDTRLYLEKGKTYFLREYVERESKTADLKVPSPLWRDSNEIVNHLPIIRQSFHRLDVSKPL